MSKIDHRTRFVAGAIYASLFGYSRRKGGPMPRGEVKPSVDVLDTDLPPDFADKVVEHIALKAQIKELTAQADDIGLYLKTMMEVEELEKVTVGRATVNVSKSWRSTIVPEKLLERGVDPKDIAYATKSTESVSMTIRLSKEDGSGGEE